MATQILNGLWLGNFEDAMNPIFHRQNHITVVINCTKDLPFLSHGNGTHPVMKYRVPIDDDLSKQEITAMSEWLGYILPLIHTHRRQGRNILIHCFAGVQRSAIVMMSYLYRYECPNRTQPRRVYEYLKFKRPIVFSPMMNFKHSFESVFSVHI
jgi:protein-tyrosine phosphatase